MKRTLGYLRNYLRESILAPLFKLLEAIFELTVPLVIAAIIDRGIEGNGGTPLILGYAGILVLLAAVGFLVAVVAQYFAAKAAVGAGTDIRRDLFRRVQSMNYADLDKNGTATLLTRLSGDTDRVQSGINMALRLFLRSPFIVFGAMIMAFTVDRESAVIFAVLIPLLFLAVFAILLLTVPLYTRVQKRLDGVLRKTRENLRGARVVRAFGMEERETAEFDGDNNALLAMQRVAGRISALLNPLTLLLVNAAVILLIYTGALRIEETGMSTGELVALYNYMSQILVELVKLANLVITSTRAVASAKRIGAVLTMDNILPEKTVTPDRPRDALVEFSRVSFRYPSATEDTLTGIDFTARRGETIGVIGGTGSGKSSLVSLIPHFYDATDGCVLVDGVNVQDIPDDVLRARIGYVPQKSVLFRGSIRKNLCFRKENATDGELWDAVRIAQATEVVENKGGLDAVIEENGQNLSGGQRQRLCIARALVGDPDILILDDSASALDYATDARLRAALTRLPDDPLIFIVSQRVASVRNADRIIVLDDGKAVGIGKHDELLRSCPVYAEIVASQTKKEDEA